MVPSRPFPGAGVPRCRHRSRPGRKVSPEGLTRDRAGSSPIGSLRRNSRERLGREWEREPACPTVTGGRLGSIPSNPRDVARARRHTEAPRKRRRSPPSGRSGGVNRLPPRRRDPTAHRQCGLKEGDPSEPYGGERAGGTGEGPASREGVHCSSLPVLYGAPSMSSHPPGCPGQRPSSIPGQLSRTNLQTRKASADC